MRRLKSSGGMLAVAVVACWAPASGLAATSPWATRANAICASWSAKAKAALGTTAPKTQSQIYAYMVKARPIEAGLLRDLRAISIPRPAGANRGLAFAAADIREIDSAVAAYRAGHKTAFVKDAEIWQSDHRTSDAFAAIGARACG